MKERKNKKIRRNIIVSIFAVILIAILYVIYRGNYLEYFEIGTKYTGVFFDNIKYSLILLVVSFLWLFSLVYSTNCRIKKGLKVFFKEENKPIPKMLNKSIAFITSAIGSIVTTKIFLNNTILFFNSTSFGKKDVIFGNDIGYYLFVKPYIQGLLIYILVTLVVVTLYAIIYYIIIMNTHFDKGVELETLKNSILKKQLLNNIKVIAIFVALLAFFGSYNLSTNTFLNVGENETVYSLVGVGTSDVTIKQWGYRGLSILIVVVAFIGANAYKKNKTRRLVGCIFSVPIYLVFMIVILAGYNKIFVDSNQYEKQKKYISYNIESTRDAYGINIDIVDLSDPEAITAEEISSYSEVIGNISNTNNEAQKEILDEKTNDLYFFDKQGKELESNVVGAEYNASAGLNINAIDKIILGVSKGDLNLAFSNIGKKGKLLINRNIVDRAKKIMPYLLYDESPYLVVTEENKLIWVIDAYTTSNFYPFSQKTTVNGQEFNYIKNSVKVFVDAYSGEIKFYIVDRTDPIVMAYRKAFPDLFMDVDAEIPKELSEQFKYSEFLYGIQAEILKRYHNTETDVMFRANDVWDIAKYGSGTSSVNEQTIEMKPYYAMLKTKDSYQSCVGLVLPYTELGKQGISGYIVGSYEDGVRKLKLYKYTTKNSVLGPMQLDTQISQNESISKQIQALQVSGTTLTKNIVVVPVNNKLIYVESIYQKYINENESTPKLKKVIVASGNKMAIGNDFSEAIENFISESINIEVGDTEDEEQLIKSIIKANKDLSSSMSNNDYEVMGKDLNRLKSLIDKLEAVREKKNEGLNGENVSVIPTL